MAKNEKLDAAKKAKNDEFYTQYEDIQREINAYLEYAPDTFQGKTVLLPCDDPEWSNFTKFFAQNFKKLGLKKLISTSYASASKPVEAFHEITLFESESPQYDEEITETKGKIFSLDHDSNNNGVIDIYDLKWEYLDGDGDFRSDEVKKLRDEADIIITNPPFSLIKEFIPWIFEARKKFLIISNINALTLSMVFPLLKNNELWPGYRFNQRVNGKNMTFLVPDNYEMNGTELYIDCDGKKFISVPGICWLTNLEHGRRHQPLVLMTMADNLKFSKHKKVLEQGYIKYDNYNAIEIPFTDAIPSDYDGEMGVPISFLGKYNPDQFSIIGNSSELANEVVVNGKFKVNPQRFYLNGKRMYDRIVIKKK